NFLPVGSYTYKITVHSGEYHFPISDAENNYYGGPTVTLLNTSNTPPLTNTTLFYDDRGYVTSNGTLVGELNKALCGVNPTNPAYSDPINGTDSTVPGFRTFGTATGGNANRKCGSSGGQAASFGDTKTLDTWTFVPSDPAIKQLEIVDAKIAGNVYEDIDRQDDFDSGEPTLPKNITINLLDNNGNLVGSTQTDSNGFYAFAGLNSGQYKVEVDTSDIDIPSIYVLGTQKTIDVVVTIDKTAIANFGFDRTEGLCDLGGGVKDPAINPYISAEVKNNSANSRQLTDSLDDNWRTQVSGGVLEGTVQPWFGTANSLGNVNNFTYIDPATYTSVNTTVELVEVPISGANECKGLIKTSSSNPQLSTSTTLQESSPRPTSLYDTSDQPAFWNQTRTSAKDGRRFAVRFNFNTPVKSFGAWFGDLESRSEYGTPAILRLLDASGNRIGQDITIEPTELYDGSSSNTQIINQIQCGSSASNTGCGNKSTRWVSFIDNYPVPRVAQALVIVGDDDYNDNGDTEILSFIGTNIISNHPNVLLVKRITSINGNTTSNDGDNLSIYNQNDSDRYDDNLIEGANPPTQPHKDTDKWPNTSGKDSSSFLIGGINGGKVEPGDEIEYTIYFLSAGNNEAKKVLFCDRVPEHTTFIPAAFNSFSTQAPNGSPGAARGILWQYNNTVESLTNTQDGDASQYFPPGVEPTTIYPDIDCGGNNSNGAVVVDLGDIPNAIAPGTPTGSYGFVRFRGQVK
ncbi:MAG: SdrD B-like domain-containing protein, partial [Cyanobacteria bacterium J06639_18]